jgi:SAM-dependent methyltransferase
VKRAVDWCSYNISRRYSNFTFQTANIYNKVYHPSGRFRADEYTFPYEDESFDFVFLNSVFTHLLPFDMENYLSEVSRVMKNGGRCFITYFLFDDKTLELLRAGKTRHVCFFHKFDDRCYVMNPDKPEMAVYYDLNYISMLYSENGLEVNGPIRFGSWCERSGKLKSFQDIIVARKMRHDTQRFRTLRRRRYARLLRPSSILQQGLSLSWRLLPGSVKSIVRRRLSK